MCGVNMGSFSLGMWGSRAALFGRSERRRARGGGGPGGTPWATAFLVGAMVVLLGCGGEDSGPSPAGMPTAPVESTPEEQAALVIFDDSMIHDVGLWMSPEDWESIINDSRGDELRPATLYIDGVTMANVGVRPAGESSRVPGNQKMSMRVEFDAFEKKRMGGFDEVKLTGSWDDPFIIRDRLAYWCYRQVMPAPREVPATLRVNGESRGIYQIEEIWGKEALAERFANPDGPLYRLRGLTNLDPYAYHGDDTSVYVPLPWDPKGMRDAAEHVVIPNALRVLAQEPHRLGEVMDLDFLLNYFAVSAIVSNTDGFTGPFEVDDHFQYFDPSTGKFFILPWDPDNTFGSINDSPENSIFLNYERSILTRMVRDGALRDPFLARLEEIMATKLTEDAIHAQAEAFSNQIMDAAYDDTTKMYPTESFIWSLGYIRDWTAKRYSSIRDQIARIRAGEPIPPTPPTGVGPTAPPMMMTTTPPPAMAAATGGGTP